MPLSDILFNSAGGNSMGDIGDSRNPFAARPVAAGTAGASLIRFGSIPPVSPSTPFVITSAHLDANSWGYYFPGQAGSGINPSTLNGASVMELLSGSDVSGCYIILDGVLAQDFFTSITINGTTMLTADATLSFTIGTKWQWPDIPFQAIGAIDGEYT